MAAKLLEDLGIAEYLQEPSCNPVTDIAFSDVQSNGWNSGKNSWVNLKIKLIWSNLFQYNDL